jgi:hypothetical protein
MRRFPPHAAAIDVGATMHMAALQYLSLSFAMT